MLNQNLIHLAFLRQSKPTVLIHGCDANASNWEKVVIGNNFPRNPGCITRGLEAAFLLHSTSIIWSTGASERDGKKESQLLYDAGIYHASKIIAYINRDVEWLHNAHALHYYIEQNSVINNRAQSVEEEIEHAVHIAHKANAKVIIQVAPPDTIHDFYQKATEYSMHDNNSPLFIPLPSMVPANQNANCGWQQC